MFLLRDGEFSFSLTRLQLDRISVGKVPNVTGQKMAVGARHRCSPRASVSPQKRRV